MFELRRAARSLLRTPNFSLAAVSTLALGIGSTVLVFSVLYSVVLRDLPFADPGRLAFIWIDDAKRGIHEEGVSYPTFLEWKARTRAFESIAVRGRPYAARLTGQNPERVQVDLVSGNLLPLLGVQPAFGRVFTEEEEQRGDLVAVISHRLAGRRYGDAGSAIGRPLEIDGRIWRVIGVMPPGSAFPHPNRTSGRRRASTLLWSGTWSIAGWTSSWAWED